MKVKDIVDGMVVWKGDTVIGVTGWSLPKIFDDCDCIKNPGNSFDYSLAPTNKYTDEQLAFISKAMITWAAADDYPIPFFADEEDIKKMKDERDPFEDPYCGAFSGSEPDLDPEDLF